MPLHSRVVTNPGPLAHALADSFADLHRTPWAGEVPLARFEEFLRGTPTRVHRGEPEHFTASAVIFSPDLARTLLCFHGKGNMWEQLGGHMEPGDLTPEAVAHRYAREESVLSEFQLPHPAPLHPNHNGPTAAY